MPVDCEPYSKVSTIRCFNDKVPNFVLDTVRGMLPLNGKVGFGRARPGAAAPELDTSMSSSWVAARCCVRYSNVRC